MFTETIEKINQQIEETKARLAELEAKKKAVMDMESRMNAVVEEVEAISQELEVYPDMLVSFERSIRETIRPHKPQKDNLEKFNSVGFVNLVSTQNPNLTLYTNDEGTDVFCVLISMNDKRLARKWEAYIQNSFDASTSLFSGSWNDGRYTLGLTYADETTLDDDSINKLLEFDYLQAPPNQETHIKYPKQPSPQPHQPKQQPTPAKKSA